MEEESLVWFVCLFKYHLFMRLTYGNESDSTVTSLMKLTNLINTQTDSN
jgi:hypothetical protein